MMALCAQGAGAAATAAPAAASAAGSGVAATTGSAAANPPAAAPARPRACTAAAYRQFDFWLGDWDAYEADAPAGSPKAAHVRVSQILDGCVVLEEYDGANGSHGRSFNIYDAARQRWHETWVTDRGTLLIVEGGLSGGNMVLEGTDPAAGSLVRGTWIPVPGGVRETALTSADGGKTWKPWFDLMFRPHQP